jgi:hypothetical protein
MTLKEKFNDLVPVQFGGMQEPLLTNCEKVADDFAIGFAHWCLRKVLITINDVDLFEYRFNIYSEKEMLKMYKTEKGL